MQSLPPLRGRSVAKLAHGNLSELESLGPAAAVADQVLLSEAEGGEN